MDPAAEVVELVDALAGSVSQVRIWFCGFPQDRWIYLLQARNPLQLPWPRFSSLPDYLLRDEIVRFVRDRA